MSSDKKRVTFNHQEESQHRIDKSVKKCQDWLKSLDSNDHSHLHIDTFKPVIRLKITDGNSSSNPLHIGSSRISPSSNSLSYAPIRPHNEKRKESKEYRRNFQALYHDEKQLIQDARLSGMDIASYKKWLETREIH